MRRFLPFALATLSLFSSWFTGAAQSQSPNSLVVVPAKIELTQAYDRLQLVVLMQEEGATGTRSVDLTHRATFAVADPNVASVDAAGIVTPLRDGETSLQVRYDDKETTIPLQAKGITNKSLDFLKDVRPVLTKAGCAAAACHAAQHGKGGFKLSVFGYDPSADYEAIVQGSRGRRINHASPDESLLIAKAAQKVSHGGGCRFDEGSIEYRLVRDWIQSGAPRPKDPEFHVTKLEVFPSSRVTQRDTNHQLRVVATFSDGTQRDVTQAALYDPVDAGILKVTSSGAVTSLDRGQSAIMIRYEGQVAASTFMIPFSDRISLESWTSHNFIDEMAAEKFADLGLEPSPVCDDATFVRRAYLDAIGSLPDRNQVQAFLESKDADKRSKLIDQLLGLTGDPSLDIYNERYAAFWTLRWSDLIRNNSASLGEQGMWAMHNWIRDAFRSNRPFDSFVKQLVTAKGSIYSNGPANYYRVHADPSALTEATSQLFMGVRLECAKCHQHPFESISQADYYRMSAFFARVGSKNSEEFGLFGRETVVMVRPNGESNHPRTGKKMDPTPLNGKPMDHLLDRRIPLAEWLTDRENPYFARAVVNRYMGYLLGVGLVDPVDDMRSTNPPSNEKLLNALAKDFTDNGYDLKLLMRNIMKSRLYSLSSQPTASNANDRRFYSHFQVKRLSAEPLLDAIDQVTGVPTKFKNLPLGTRAIELPDAEYPDYFLNTFAKPKRVSVCECERSPDANLAQALHTLNGDTLTNKIAHKNGNVAKWLQSNLSHDEIVREIYLAALCRYPSEDELEASAEFLTQSTSAQDCYQDLVWALLNSKSFLFNR